MEDHNAIRDVAEILNACWWVRRYKRGGRVASLALHRKQAILKLGLVCREAFNRADDYEPILTALVDGLQRRNDPPF